MKKSVSFCMHEGEKRSHNVPRTNDEILKCKFEISDIYADAYLCGTSFAKKLLHLFNMKEKRAEK